MVSCHYLVSEGKEERCIRECFVKAVAFLPTIAWFLRVGNENVVRGSKLNLKCNASDLQKEKGKC